MTGGYRDSDGDVEERMPELEAEIGNLHRSIDGLAQAVADLRRDVNTLFTTQKDNFVALLDRQDSQFASLVKREDAFLGSLATRHDEMIRRQDTHFATCMERLDGQYNALVKREDEFLGKIVSRHDEMVDRQHDIFEVIVKRQDERDARQLTNFHWLVGTAITVAGLVAAKLFVH